MVTKSPKTTRMLVPPRITLLESSVISDSMFFFFFFYSFFFFFFLLFAARQEVEQQEMSLADREEGETLTGPMGEAGEQLLLSLYVSQDLGSTQPLTARSTTTLMPAASTPAELSRPVTPKILGKARSDISIKVEPVPAPVPALLPRSRGGTAASERPPSARTGTAPTRERTATRERPASGGDTERPASRPTAGGNTERPASRPTAGGNTERPASRPTAGGSERQTEAEWSAQEPPSREAQAAGRPRPAKADAPPTPSKKVLEKISNQGGTADLGEYYSAFSTRPKIPKTPEGHQG
jgi:hypothetical protein